MTRLTSSLESGSVGQKRDKPANTIYDRIKSDLGISKPFVKKTLLPDWWDDELLRSPNGLLQFKAYLRRNLGLPLESWDGNKKIKFSEPLGVHFKKSSAQSNKKFSISIQIAKTVGTTSISMLRREQKIPRSAEEVRKHLSWNPMRLTDVLNYFNSLGIPIIPIWGLPRTVAKPTAMVFKIEDHYAIAIGKKTTSESQQIFHLFHELGHIVSGHLNGNTNACIDETIDKDTEDKIETEANRFAVAVFTGNPNFETHMFVGGTHNQFLHDCKSESRKIDVDPSFIALNLAWSNPKDKHTLWRLANFTLKKFEQAKALEMIVEHFYKMIQEDRVSAEYLDYLRKLTRI